MTLFISAREDKKPEVESAPEAERNGMYRHGLNMKEAVKERRFLVLAGFDPASVGGLFLFARARRSLRHSPLDLNATITFVDQVEDVGRCLQPFYPSRRASLFLAQEESRLIFGALGNWWTRSWIMQLRRRRA
jgi:hypothetical protein